MIGRASNLRAIQLLQLLKPSECSLSEIETIVNIFHSLDITLYISVIEWMKANNIHDSASNISQIVRGINTSFTLQLSSTGHAVVMTDNTRVKASTLLLPAQELDLITKECSNNDLIMTEANFIIGDFLLLNSASQYWWKVIEIDPRKSSVLLNRCTDITVNNNSSSSKKSLDMKFMHITSLLGATVMKIDPLQPNTALLFSFPRPPADEIIADLTIFVDSIIEKRVHTQKQSEIEVRLRSIQLRGNVNSWTDHKQRLAQTREILSQLTFEDGHNSDRFRDLWLCIGRTLRCISSGYPDLLPDYLIWSNRHSAHLNKHCTTPSHTSDKHGSHSPSNDSITIDHLCKEIWNNTKVASICDHPYISRARVCLKAANLYKEASEMLTPIDTTNTTSQRSQAFIYKMCALDVLSQHTLEVANELLLSTEGLIFTDPAGNSTASGTQASEEEDRGEGSSTNPVQLPSLIYEYNIDQYSDSAVASQVPLEVLDRNGETYAGTLVGSAAVPGVIKTGDYLRVAKTLIPLQYHRYFPSAIESLESGSRGLAGVKSKASSLQRGRPLPATSRITLQVLQVDTLFARLLVAATSLSIPQVFSSSGGSSGQAFWVLFPLSLSTPPITLTCVMSIFLSTAASIKPMGCGRLPPCHFPIRDSCLSGRSHSQSVECILPCLCNSIAQPRRGTAVTEGTQEGCRVIYMCVN